LLWSTVTTLGPDRKQPFETTVQASAPRARGNWQILAVVAPTAISNGGRVRHLKLLIFTIFLGIYIFAKSYKI
jgi:hypothetical protein